MSLADPARSSTCIYNADGKTVLAVYSQFDIPIGLHLEINQIDASGQVVAPPPIQEPVWNESFRYYRLSQCSNDLFDAYRNLFLAFEALLNSICRKKSSEGEGSWLHRALTTVNSKTSLAHITPTGEGDAVLYIIKTQYKGMRCHLQHAKFPEAKLPHAKLTPQDVQQAYGELVRIWRQIAGAYFSVTTGGSVITYIGFSTMMQNAFNAGASIYYTTDKSPPTNEDTAVSPKGLPSWAFGISTYEGPVRPGVVRIVGREQVLSKMERYQSPIYRICTTTNAAPIGVAYIKSGISISGVDEWECIHDLRLINSDQPRVEFKT